jgi:hypothetical protein
LAAKNVSFFNFFTIEKKPGRAEAPAPFARGNFDRETRVLRSKDQASRKTQSKS